MFLSSSFAPMPLTFLFLAAEGHQTCAVASVCISCVNPLVLCVCCLFGCVCVCVSVHFEGAGRGLSAWLSS